MTWCAGPRPGGRPGNGFALIGALFLLLVLSALAVHVATLTGVAHDSVRLGVEGKRAHFAARSALEWALSDIVNAGAANLACGAGPVTFTLTEAALSGYDVAVDCVSSSVTEGASTYTLYELTATGSHGIAGTPTYAARSLVATATD